MPMNENCNPTYGKVDDILDLLTKSKSLHLLMELDRAEKPLRFTQIKRRVQASSTTVSRRLKELEECGLIAVTKPTRHRQAFMFSRQKGRN